MKLARSPNFAVAVRNLFYRLLLLLVFSQLLSAAPLLTNTWIKSNAGVWHEPESWSLGSLPEATHSVLINVPSVHTIEINAATAQDHSDSLTLGDLTISQNKLWLNTGSTNVPLRIVNNLASSNATFVSSASALVLEKGGLLLQKGDFIQDGGLVQVISGAVVIDLLAYYHLTNGLFETPLLKLGNGYGGFFYQWGGEVRADEVVVSANSIGSSYHLQDGILISGSMHVGSVFSSDAVFHHAGTNFVAGELRLASGSAPARYYHDSGFLGASNVTITAGGTDAFLRSHGTIVVTNLLSLRGGARYYPPIPNWAAYTNAWRLTARSLEMDEFASMTISGIASISESVQFIGTDQYAGRLHISGTLACSNLLSGGANVDITQTGGALIVSNRFTFAGWYPGVYNRGGRFARYDFASGTFSARDIQLSAEWIIGNSSQSGRIQNSGTFTMGGILRVGEVTEQFGEFILSTNALIDFQDGSARLDFASSSSQEWRPDAVLMVSGWNGDLDGGEGDQLRFGRDGSGLTFAQLGQIRFRDPVALPRGVYPAKLLATGEIVPDPSSLLRQSRIDQELVLIWNPGFTLQTSTNVQGPYADLESAASPFHFDAASGTQRFFRLRQTTR